MNQRDLIIALNTAKQALIERRLDDAVSLLKDIDGRQPDSPDVLSMLGVAYAEKGSYAEALGCYERSLSAKPTSRGYFNVANIYKMQKNYALARIALIRALEIDPHYDRALKLMSEIAAAATPPPVPAEPAAKTTRLVAPSPTVPLLYNPPPAPAEPASIDQAQQNGINQANDKKGGLLARMTSLFGKGRIRDGGD
ncbi:MAG: tetratricopeptide repeat protein [Armatimonadota bacterium]|nr:tetratricopeptide repeat protein [Armatimonadota bacterium]